MKILLISEINKMNAQNHLLFESPFKNDRLVYINDESKTEPKKRRKALSSLEGTSLKSIQLLKDQSKE